MFEQKSVPQGAVQQEGEGVQISLPASGWLELAVSRTNSSSSLVGVMCSLSTTVQRPPEYLAPGRLRLRGQSLIKH